MTFLEYLKTASPLIGGRVTDVWKDQTNIEADISLPTDDGHSTDRFAVPPYDYAGREGAHVVFRWAKPGTKDLLKGRGKACEVKVVSSTDRESVTEKLRTRQKLVDDLHRVLEDAGDLAAALEEAEALLDDPPSALAIALAAYERARSLIQNEERTRRQLGKLERQLHDSEARLEELRSIEARLLEEEERLAPLRTEVIASRLKGEYEGRRAPDTDAGATTLDELDGALGGLATAFARRTTIVSLLTASIQGRMVLLDGPVGAGKTSVAEQVAVACGGGCQVIPVRPSWVEPADLLGFYDPVGRVFRPGPFTEAVTRSVEDRLNAVVLDEMNLARIENYAADVLSSMERIAAGHQRGGSSDGIPAWSPAEWRGLKAEWEILAGLETPPPELAHRKVQLIHSLQLPPTLVLGDGTVLVGTLNSDDTTYDLSPKVIDRSFAVSFPTASLEPAQDPPRRRLGVSMRQLRAFVGENAHPDRDKLWRRLVATVSQETMSRLGVPFSHRVVQDFDCFVTLGHHLQADGDELVAMFLFARVLPRIRFFKEGDRTSEALETLERVRTVGPASSDRAWDSLLHRLEQQCTNERTRFVRFWHGETA